ncbi:electron transport complex subunit RsxC [Parasporobacterium paucivorans]|uniref:Ion-translocating oxidoreductase complex subunit C n=1 Tax=Parasporobacterium paucivorans DSM 15970 TaxID=1122934 RepID=A0A1M6ADF0_9FIRM|nr:electron transport complex subunit RsxC [Parasporobacterium paucivorans]SHI34441.1 electron transport complex protein RnfC [Parasporobacterium paucivorans DSM 15970]
MAVFTFKGGVHPDDGKRFSKDKHTEKFYPTGEMVYPVSQHIGAPAVPVVSVGDRVLAGQLIAEAAGFVSANIFASVSGTVKAIESRLVISGDMINSIVIENDGQYEEAPALVVKPLEELSKEEIRGIIKSAGIVGLGGAGFPTHVKLTPKDDNAIDYIIINAAECEPYITADYRRMMEQPEKIIDGIKVCLAVFPKARCIIAIEDNKPDAIALFKKLLKDEQKIEVKAVYTKYPQGSERHLINAVTGRYINSKMLPADAGCIVDNVDTVNAVGRAVLEGKPLTSRIMTVSGDAVKEPKNYEIFLGTNISELLEDAGLKEEPEKILSGGPMMGIAMFNTNVPAVKTSSATLCFLKDIVAAVKPSNCISCGRCLEVCPSRIMPTKLEVYSKNGDKEMFLKFDGMECCECGCCSFACPAKRNLAQAIKSMRKQILNDRKKC